MNLKENIGVEAIIAHQPAKTCTLMRILWLTAKHTTYWSRVEAKNMKRPSGAKGSRLPLWSVQLPALFLALKKDLVNCKEQER